ncbi:MAG: hypothetical protein JWO43_323 [Candidatus Adlerbacteria bacterium]|nr:hypothetical protein [Candidatus Adlerbacteria bacterium]
MMKPAKLSLIVIYGAPGAGKTTLADLLHTELSNTAHIGVDHIKRFISEFREVASHQDVSKKVINAMAAEYLQNHISVIVEQGIDLNELNALKEIAAVNSAEFFVYRLEISRDLADKRAAERMEALGKPAIPQEVLDTLNRTHEGVDYSNTAVLNSGELTTQEMADRILKDLI